MLSIRNIKLLNRGVVALTAAVLVLMILRPNFMRMWDAEFFAIFQNNQPEAYDTPEKKRDAAENTDVLYYREGVDSTISSIKIKGGDQALLVNGSECEPYLTCDHRLMVERPKAILRGTAAVRS